MAEEEVQQEEEPTADMAQDTGAGVGNLEEQNYQEFREELEKDEPDEAEEAEMQPQHEEELPHQEVAAATPKSSRHLTSGGSREEEETFGRRAALLRAPGRGTIAAAAA